MKRTFWMLLSLLSFVGLQAQIIPATVMGFVKFSANALPAAGYPVAVYDLSNGNEVFGITDDLGAYEIPVNLTAETESLLVEVYDFCSGEALNYLITTSSEDVYVAEPFFICEDIMPPPPPTGCNAAFYAQELNPLDPLTFQFHDLSFSEQPITSWQWDFGDGTSSNLQNPVHTYDTTGGYEVTLTIVADKCSSVFSIWINIGSGDCVCTDEYDPVCVWVLDDIWQDTIILNFPNACYAMCEGFSPDQFINCDSTGGCFCPDFYDPVCVVTPAGDTIQFSNICYAACEGYTPDQLIDCNNTGGCSCFEIYDPVCVMVLDDISQDTIILSFPNACYAMCEGFTADQFINCDSTGSCFCPDFYDPVCVQLSPDEAPLHFINACYAMCAGFTPDQFVTCEDECICPDIYAPVCVATPSGGFIQFDNECYAICAGFLPDHLIDCDSLSTCYANFFMDFGNPASPLTVQFTDASFAANGETPSSWHWSFGDGNTSTEQNPEHTYAADGIYEVTLTISTPDGCESITTLHICIGNGGGWEGPECQAMFYFVQDSSDLSTFHFQNYSLGDINSWSWNFGDGNTSNEQNPTHTYSQPGVYIVTLTASGNGCTNTVSMIVVTDDNILYENTCTALFLPFIYSDSLTVFCLNLSSPDAVSFAWDFGDGTSSSDPFGVHQYAVSGSYVITLTIVTADGCTSTFSTTINFEDGNFQGAPQYSILNNTAEAARIERLIAQPNPASAQVVLSMQLAGSSDLRIEILSAEGKLMASRQEGQAVGKHLSIFDISSWVPGLYIARIQSGTEVHSLRFVKQ